MTEHNTETLKATKPKNTDIHNEAPQSSSVLSLETTLSDSHVAPQFPDVLDQR